MTRTQVYLSKAQEQSLKMLALTSGTKQSELIRRAVDLLLEQEQTPHMRWKTSLGAMRGVWRADDDAETRMAEIRSEFDR